MLTVGKVNGIWWLNPKKAILLEGAVEIFGTFMRHQVEIIQAYVDPKFQRLKIMETLFFPLNTTSKN